MKLIKYPSKEQWAELLKRPAKREGIKTPSAVQYVERAGHIKKYHGTYRILKVILSYDYLWIQVRVKGGAYGCMSGFKRNGESYLVSYRDPHLKRTLDVYKGIPDYIRNFQADERDMTKYVIGTISNLDAPLTPSVKGSRGLSAYLSGVTEEMMQTEREQVLQATKEDIRALAAHVRAVLQTGSFCVVGNEEKIEANRAMFGEVSSLTRG